MNSPESPRQTVRPAQVPIGSWLNYFLFAAATGLFLLPFMRFVLAVTDEGTLLTGAVRVSQGQIFARDFFEVAGPGTFYLLAGFFKIFGATFLVARTYLFLSLLGTGLSIYFLSLKICRRYKLLPVLILSGTYFGIVGQAISYHLDSNFAALAAVICLVHWQSRPRNFLVAASGFLAGITTCILQPKGVLLFCAFAFWLWLQDRRVSVAARRFCWLAGGYFLVIVFLLGYFWSQGALGSFIYANVLFPLRDYDAVNAVTFAHGLLNGGFWTFWVSLFGGVRWSVVGAAVMIAPLMLLVLLPILILFAGVRYRWKSAPPEVLLLWLSGYALWLSEIHRKDVAHLVWGAPLLVILGVHLLGESRGKFAGTFAAVFSVSSICLAACNFLLIAVDAKPVATRVGTVTSAQPNLAEVMTFLDQHVQPGSDILVYPFSASYYFFSKANNPTPYSILVYNYNTPEQFRQVIRILDQKRVEYVVWDTNFIPKMEKKIYPGAPPIRPGDLILEPYLEARYRQVNAYDGVLIMERIIEDGSNKREISRR